MVGGQPRNERTPDARACARASQSASLSLATSTSTSCRFPLPEVCANGQTEPRRRTNAKRSSSRSSTGRVRCGARTRQRQAVARHLYAHTNELIRRLNAMQSGRVCMPHRRVWPVANSAHDMDDEPVDWFDAHASTPPTRNAHLNTAVRCHVVMAAHAPPVLRRLMDLSHRFHRAAPRRVETFGPPTRATPMAVSAMSGAVVGGVGTIASNRFGGERGALQSAGGEHRRAALICDTAQRHPSSSPAEPVRAGARPAHDASKPRAAHESATSPCAAHLTDASVMLSTATKRQSSPPANAFISPTATAVGDAGHTARRATPSHAPEPAHATASSALPVLTAAPTAATDSRAAPLPPPLR